MRDSGARLERAEGEDASELLDFTYFPYALNLLVRILCTLCCDTFQKNDITVVTKYASGIADQNASITPVIQRRALKPHGFSNSEKCKIKNSRLPNKPCIIQEYGAKVFCGSYSKDGKFFITATQGTSLLCVIKFY